ncbi:hypothetical protein RAS1_40590 [Phycisphaerae bacterium RAS1]|nr:hypothetical protein RAS1_40590 [Phycisphaerae bacterium RAS1]
MCYQGRVRNGVIVLEEGHSLPEGTIVEVVAAATGDEDAEAAKLSEELLKLAGTVRDLPADFARQHDHYLHGQPKR